VGKHNIDDILNELGVESPAGAPAAPAREGPRRLRRPGAESDDEAVFHPLPSMPANQTLYGGSSAPAQRRETQPPAAATGGTPSSPSTAGPAPGVRQIYQPEVNALARTTELVTILQTRGIVPADKLNTAQQVVRQSPGRRLSDVLIEQGCDETSVQQAVAESAGVPFERIDLSKGVDGGFDGKLTQRLGVDFCKDRQIVPLRTEGSRVVIAGIRHDDVFLTDEIKSKLGVASVKMVLTTAFDIKGVLEIVGGEDKPVQEDVDLTSILSEVDESDVQVEKAHNAEVDLEKQAKAPSSVT